MELVEERKEKVGLSDERRGIGRGRGSSILGKQETPNFQNFPNE
jgi:hypothetical protein